MARGTLGGLTDPNVWKVSVRFKIDQSNCQTGFKLRDVAAQDNDAGEVIDAVLPWVNANLRPLLTPADEIVAVDVTRIGGEEGQEHLFTGLFGSTNTSADKKHPSFMAVKISLKTNLRKRYGQGRMFWPLRDDNLSDGDFLNAAGIAAYNGAVAALTDAFSGSGVTHDLVLVNTHGIIPARNATATRPARAEIPASWYDVDSVKVDRTLTALRSRKLGIGA